MATCLPVAASHSRAVLSTEAVTTLGSRHLQELRAELRAIELIQLAKEKGFRDNLAETQKAYGACWRT
jgi:hypothetical protein